MLFLKKWWKHFLLVILLFALPVFAIKFNGAEAVKGITWGIVKDAIMQPSVKIHDLGVNYGVYDHERKFANAKGLAFEHYFYQWNDYDSEQFRRDMQYAAERGRWSLITIEPYPFQQDSIGVKNLFADILNGLYDELINKFHDDLVEFGKPVFLRWGHEMEKVTGRYPWAQDDFKGYSEAYRYFYDKMKNAPIEVYFVWSPVGNKEMFDYWPGSDYVDQVGVSLYGLPEWDIDHFGKVQTFEEIFAEKYDRAKVFDKPVMITELGVSGEKTHQAYWMYEAFRSFEKFPLLQSVVYFNAKDSELAWDTKYGVPDWRIDSALFDQYDFTGSY